MTQQLCQDHGIADVRDEELVETQKPSLGGDAVRHVAQRIRLSGKTAEFRMDPLHEAVEMQAQTISRRRLVQ